MCLQEGSLNYMAFTTVFLEEMEGKMYMKGAINGNTGSFKPDRWVYFNQ